MGEFQIELENKVPQKKLAKLEIKSSYKLRNIYLLIYLKYSTT